MNCFLKGFISRRLNKLLEGGEGKIQKARESVAVWTGRAEKICAALKSLSAKLEDNKLDPEELEAAVAEIKALVESWK